MQAADEQGDHIPDSILARWDRRHTSLRGLERELVRRHLESCEMCREALVILGHDPVLPRVDSLEANAAVRAALDAASEESFKETTEHGTTAKVVQFPRWSARERWLGAWGGLATAAAAWLAVSTTRLAPTIDGSLSVGAAQGTLTSAAPATPIDPTRSSGEPVVSVVVAPGSVAVSIFAQPGDLRPGEPVIASVLSGTEVLAQDTLSSHDFREDRTLVWRSPAPIAPGDYSLILATPARSDTFPFRVAVE
jgi:hypothetical protein